MSFFQTDADLARELDSRDELAAFRDEFVIADSNLIYLDGNSLGRLPKRTVAAVNDDVAKVWGERLFRGWNDGWISTPTTLGAKIARLVGAQPNEIVVAEATSVNLFKLTVAALRARPLRNTIVSDVFNFPSDLYVLQGVIDLLGQQHRLELVPSDDGITIEPRAVNAAFDDDTALVSLTHVAFKSAFMHDMAAVTDAAHRAGALVLWDLCHSAGAVPVDLNGANVDLAVGCSYKYLNGGPGAPAFLYVRHDLQERLTQPIWGWFSSERPFAFDLGFSPAKDIRRYWVSTPPMLSMRAIEPAVDILLEAGMDRLRAKSVRQTEYLIFLAEQWLTPVGFCLGSPREPRLRGSHVSLRHPEAYRISRALSDPQTSTIQVIADFREPDNLRLGVAPLYNTFSEIHRAVDRLQTIVNKRLYDRYPVERATVT